MHCNAFSRTNSRSLSCIVLYFYCMPLFFYFSRIFLLYWYCNALALRGLNNTRKFMEKNVLYRTSSLAAHCSIRWEFISNFSDFLWHANDMLSVQVGSVIQLCIILVFNSFLNICCLFVNGFKLEMRINLQLEFGLQASLSHSNKFSEICIVRVLLSSSMMKVSVFRP